MTLGHGSAGDVGKMFARVPELLGEFGHMLCIALSDDKAVVV